MSGGPKAAKQALERPPDAGLGFILNRLVSALDLDQLRSGRPTALDGDRGPAAAEVASDQRDKLLVCLAIYGRRFELSDP